MENHLQKATEKLDRETKGFKGDRYGQVVYKPTAEMLKTLCASSAELARAVAEGGTLTDCIKSIKFSGSAVSDLEVYAAAVKYYLPGADVKYSMDIVLDQTETKPERAKILKFDLADLL